MFDVSMERCVDTFHAKYPPTRHDQERGQAQGPMVVTAIGQGRQEERGGSSIRPVPDSAGPVRSVPLQLESVRGFVRP